MSAPRTFTQTYPQHTIIRPITVQESPGVHSTYKQSPLNIYRLKQCLRTHASKQVPDAIKRCDQQIQQLIINIESRKQKVMFPPEFYSEVEKILESNKVSVSDYLNDK